MTIFDEILLYNFIPFLYNDIGAKLFAIYKGEPSNGYE